MMDQLYEKLLRPVAFRLDAETAHEIGMRALRLGLGGHAEAGPDLQMAPRFGLKFRGPVGLAAGFDKNGVAVDRLADLGFGSVEVGTVTLRPQSGNEKPRLFRLPADRALINRLGFNNDGAEAVAARLAGTRRKCIVGVNIGKNKDVPNEEAVENYLACFDIVHPVADYITVNISSPNTPGLRELQKGEGFEELIDALVQRNIEIARDHVPKPLLVKIAPDLTEQEIEAITDQCVRHGVLGIIATNTTVTREGLKTAAVDAIGAGGLSGAPLRARATEVISSIYRYSAGKLPIIGVGGIFTAEDAFEKLAAGACLLQAYTGFVYSGPGFPAAIHRGLAELMQKQGISSLDELVGSRVTGR